MNVNLGNVVGLLVSETAPTKKYVIWAKPYAGDSEAFTLFKYDYSNDTWVPYDIERGYFLPAIDGFNVSVLPTSPAYGDAYIISASPTGNATGKGKQHASWNGFEWLFTIPKAGAMVRSKTVNTDSYVYIAGEWSISSSSGATVENGLTLVDGIIKLGGVLTDTITVIEGDPTKAFKIGKFENGANLAFFGVYSQSLEFSQFIDHDTFQGNNLTINPGGLTSRNSYFDYQETVITHNPIAAILRFSNNKVIYLNLFGGVNVGENITINGITFTEGVDFTSQADAALDALSISNIDYSSVPNFVSVAVTDTSTLVYTFTENATIETSIVNSFLQTRQNHRKVLVDEDGVLLKSRNNEVTLTDDSTNINSNNINIVQSANGVIKNTLYFNAFGSFLSNRDTTDSSISSASLMGGYGSTISNFNNKKIGLQISGEILVGESFTINGITFTEGVDFTTVNDPTLDAAAIANIDYSSVPNFVSVSSVNDFVTFVFNTIDNTIVSNITNSYVANYLFTTAVFAGKDFALIQSNNSGLKIGDEGHTFADNTIEKQGIRYAEDYSATYTVRSLVDKAYADTKASKATVLRYSSTSATIAATLVTVNDEGIVTATDVANSSLITNSSGLSGITVSDTLNWLKAYTDSSIAGLKFKLDCVAASIANVNINSGPSTLDDVTLVTGDRVLLKNQTDATQNGCYIFNGVGSVLTRSTDADTGEELVSATFPIKGGTINQDTWFTCTNDSITIGATSIVFAQTGGAGTYTNGAGLTLTGNVFSISAGAITNAMLAGSIDLATKVTGVLSPANGGTGIANNPAYTITLGGAITTSNNVIIGSSNHTVSFVTTGNTSVTLPTSGTLYGTLANSITSAQLLASLTDETGTGVVVFSTSPTLTTPNIASIKGNITTVADGATITFNKSTSDFHQTTLAGNRTLALSNMAAGDRIVLRLVQDATGSRTVTWFSTIKWAGGVAPTLTTTGNKADVFGFLCTSTGNYDGFVIGQNI